MYEFAGDPQRAAIHDARKQVPRGAVTAHLDGLLACADAWSATRLVDEALDLARDMVDADRAVMFRPAGPLMQCVGCRPRQLGDPLCGDAPVDWFPWGLPQVQPRRFLLVDDATGLRLPDGRTLGQVGIASVVHLPLAGPDAERGALHLHWAHTVDRWDDRVGALLRAVGSFVLHRVVRADLPRTQQAPH